MLITIKCPEGDVMYMEFIYLGIGLAFFAVAGFSLITYLEKTKRNNEV